MSGYEVSFTCEADPGALDRLFVAVDAGVVSADRTMVTVFSKKGDVICMVDSRLVDLKIDERWRRRRIRARVAARKRRRGW